MPEANMGMEVTKNELNIRGYDIILDTSRNCQNRMSRTCIIIRLNLTYTVGEDPAKYEIPEIWVERGEQKC
jgi:hypothetical protein